MVSRAPWRGGEAAGVLAAAAVAAGLLAIAVAPQSWLFCSGLLVVVVVGVAWPAVTIRRVDATLRIFGSRGREGDSIHWQLEVTNRWPWRVTGLVVDGAWMRGEEPWQLAIPVVHARDTVVIHGEWQPTRRGELPAGDWTISTAFPFGLWRWQRDVTLADRMLIWPRQLAARGALLAFAAPSWGHSIGTRSACAISEATRPGGTQGETSGVRPFRSGDSWRDIHWVLSSRQDRLIVKERHRPERGCIVVALDCDPTIQFGSGRDASFEWLVRIAASLATTAHAEGAEVRLRLGAEGRELVIQSARQLAVVLDLLAQCEPNATCMAPPLGSRLTRPTRATDAEIWITTDRRVKSGSPPTQAIVFAESPRECLASAECDDSIFGSRVSRRVLWIHGPGEAEFVLRRGSGRTNHVA